MHGQDTLSVTPAFNPTTPIKFDTPIELTLNRALKADEGLIAVMIGTSDVTSLFITNGTRLIYSPTLLPLPLGEQQIVVYLIGTDNAWRELNRIQIHVVKEVPASNQTVTQQNETPLVKVSAETPVDGATAIPDNGNATTSTPIQSTPSTAAPTDAIAETSKPTASPDQPGKGKFGFEKWEWIPSLTLGIKSQPAQFNFPDSTRPTERATFADGTLQFSQRTEMNRGWFGAQTSFDFAGSSFQPEALRFGTLGKRAPQLDLSSYLIQLKLARAKVDIGHTSMGSSRHLISAFSSRGITVTLPITKRFDVSVGALNGTNVVGYGNFFGLARDKHQLQSVTLGVELLPARPGGLRLEFSGINSYIQALNNFSQGAVNDVERSRGGSVRLIATDKSGRLKFEGGFTRSQYRNPADPLLYQGTNTLAVPFLTRNARYAEVTIEV
ncbi:MAG: hypothetical protein DMF69_08935, partial [Acidobacteria bacterium]